MLRASQIFILKILIILFNFHPYIGINEKNKYYNDTNEKNKYYKDTNEKNKYYIDTNEKNRQ